MTGVEAHYFLLGCYACKISLSGRQEQFTSIDRDRCPTPAMKEPMEPFRPRVLTENVVCLSFLKHNKEKLENPSFLPNLMTLSDDEIRSKCIARYHAAPEPLRNALEV